MNNILITAGTTALALRLKKNLSPNFNVFLADSNEIPSVVKNQYLQLPKDNSFSFVHEVLKVALDSHINYILPLNDKEIIRLSQNITLFEEYGIDVLIPEADELLTIKTTNNPDKSLPLALLQNGKNLINGDQTKLSVSGLGYISDSEEDFILVAL